MFELTALALINQLANVGLGPVVATRIIVARRPARQLDGVLSDVAAQALHTAEDLDVTTAAADRVQRAEAI